MSLLQGECKYTNFFLSWSDRRKKLFFVVFFFAPRVGFWVLFPLVEGEKNSAARKRGGVGCWLNERVLLEFFPEIERLCPNDDIVFSADVLVVEIVDDHTRVGAHVPDGSVRSHVHAIYDIGIITVQLYGNTDIRSLFYIVRVCDGS